MSALVFSSLVLLLAPRVSSHIDFCSDFEICSGVPSIICENPSCSLGSSCGAFRQELPMTDDIRQYIEMYVKGLRRSLLSHNAMIGEKEMEDISYDMGMEPLAQCWANQCVFGHDNCRRHKPLANYVGQSIGLKETSMDALKDTLSIFQFWHDEILTLSTSTVAYSDDYNIYSNMAWKNITHLACGRVIYALRSVVMQLVCNFRTNVDMGGHLMAPLPMREWRP